MWDIANVCTHLATHTRALPRLVDYEIIIIIIYPLLNALPVVHLLLEIVIVFKIIYILRLYMWN